MEHDMKKNSLIFTTLVVLLFSGCTKKEDTKLTTEKQKFSYAIGQQMAQSLKSQGMEIDAPALALSIDDVMKGTPPRLSEEEMKKAIDAVREQVIARNKAKDAETKAQGMKYLEENKKKANIKTTASGLQYEVLTDGKGDLVTLNDTVQVHYRGTLTDGTEFDSSYKRNQPAEFPVTGVIKGWTEALQLMKTGSKWKLYLPSDLAYGERGGPGIPANSVLVFEVELLKITKLAKK